MLVNDKGMLIKNANPSSKNRLTSNMHSLRPDNNLDMEKTNSQEKKKRKKSTFSV